MKILFAGGGTLGPVTPLLAVADEIRRRKPDAECVFVGTPDGPERRLVEEAGMRFLPLKAPKLRRYASPETLKLPFALAAAVWKAAGILKKEKPDIVVGAGGFVQVPLMFAARLRGVKRLIHQQDVVPSLSNRLTAGGAAATAVFESSLRDFPKAEVIGNPVRRVVEEGDRAKGLALLGVSGELPVVLAFGGGTGSVFLNDLIASASPLWTGFAELAHITGLEKEPSRLPKLTHPERYHRFDFVGADIAHLMAAADVVISRAGMGTLTELAALAKPVILVPIADSHQEKNAGYVVERGGARMFRELDLTPEQLVTFTRDLLKKPEDARRLGLGLQALFRPGAREALAEKVLALVS